MTEDMKRLINDNKIVGYELHCPINDSDGASQAVYLATDITISENVVDLLDYTDYELDNIIEYDSFDMGIKIGDEWWFANDDISINGTIKTLSFGEYVDTGTGGILHGWYLKGKGYERGISVADLINCKAKRIGSIYNKKEIQK